MRYLHVLISVIVLLFASTASAQKKPVEKRIVVVLSQQKVFAFEGDKLVLELHCSTGKKGYTTPTTAGNPVKIAAKIISGRALAEFGGGELPYQMRVHIGGKRISFHTSKSVPNYPASHGCIRLRAVDAQALYRWAPKDTPVWIHRSPPGC